MKRIIAVSLYNEIFCFITTISELDAEFYIKVYAFLFIKSMLLVCTIEAKDKGKVFYKINSIFTLELSLVTEPLTPRW